MSAPHTFTVQQVNGVPFWKDSAGALYMYGSSPPVRVGLYDAEKKEGRLDTDWKTSADAFLLQYRQTLGEFTESSLADLDAAGAAAQSPSNKK
jgi:hypothetical protein